MALSDCPKCWNTPCDCGHDYKDWSVEALEKMATLFGGLVIEKTKQQMSTLPKKIIRVDDGAEFLLNEVTQTYYIWLPIRGLNESGGFGYTYERLMEDPRSKGTFKVADGTEDLLTMKKRWMDEMNRVSNNSHGGYGDEDDE
jgi:hypothetical protein